MERLDNVEDEAKIAIGPKRPKNTERTTIRVGKFTVTYNKPIGIDREPRYSKSSYIRKKQEVYRRAKKRGIKLNFIYQNIKSIEQAINDKIINDAINKTQKKENLKLIKKQIIEFQNSNKETIRFANYPSVTNQEMFDEIFTNTIMRPQFITLIGLERLTNGQSSLTWRTFNAKTANTFNSFKANQIMQGEQMDSWTIQFENISTLSGIIINQFPIGTPESYKDRVKKQFSEIDQEAKRIFPLIEKQYNNDEIKLTDVKKVVVEFVSKHIKSSTKNKIEELINENLEIGNTRGERAENRKKISNWTKAVPKFDKKEKKSGAFFPYLNDKTNIDLTRYGIYNTIDKDNYKTNCLLLALKMSGKFTDETIDNLKQYIKNHKVPVGKLKLVANAIGCSIRIKHMDRNDTTYGNYNDVIEIGLIAGHYFIVEQVYYTTYAIKNYQLEKDRINFNKLIKHDEYGTPKNYIDSFKCIKLMLETDQFTPITLDSENIQATQYYNSIEQEIASLKYPEQAVRPTRDEEPKIRGGLVGYADFEATTNGDKHVAYLACYVNDEQERSFRTNPAISLLKHLTNGSITYFHNLSYDFSFIAEHVKIRSIIKTGSSIKQVVCRYYSKTLIFRDSMAMISDALSEFPRIFKIKVKKEIMPYKLYSEKRVTYKDVGLPFAVKCLDKKPNKEFLIKARKFMTNGIFDYNKYAETLDTNKEKFLTEAADFITNGIFDYNAYSLYLNELEFKETAKDFITNDRFDHMGYAEFYCFQDCRVLMQGFETFRKWVGEAFKLDPIDFVSLPALSHRYFVASGCFDGVYELSGTPRAFIQKCLQGGRCMTRDNAKHKVMGPILDFDGVSLYPSAMSRMGYLKGVPKVLDNSMLNMEYLNCCDGYFIEVTNVKINKSLHFPLQPELKNGIKNYTNEITNNIFIDKVAAEDLIRFQKATFDVVRGYYFDEGRNYTIKSVITHCFNTRVQKKKEDNPIEVAYKLLMNAAYGKTIQKPIDVEKRFTNSDEEYKQMIISNYNLIEEFNQISDVQWCFNITKAINIHFSHPHVGIEILSMSKRIMNEVMCLAEDINIEVYYQDTDSMHIKQFTNGELTLDLLSKAYANEYHRELVGESLGQFHSDFKLEGCKSPISTMAFFLGKKCYYDKLEGIDAKGNIITGHHIRMKGVGEKAVLHKGDPLKIFTNLYDNETIQFNLSEAKPTFGTNKDFSKFTKKDFVRNISFKDGSEPVDEIIEIT
jgi:hypothetical protein